MDQELLAQLKLWHEEGEYEPIVDRILQIPRQDRDYNIVSHLARAMNNLERYEDALQQLLTIAKEGERDPLWHFRAGYSYYYLKQYEDAVREFEIADQLDPEDEHTLMMLDRSRRGAKRSHKKPSVRRSGNGLGQVPFEDFDFSHFWEDSDYALQAYTAQPPTDELIAAVEQELGYKLPASYIAMMKLHNGGIPHNTCFPTEEGTSWAEDHIAITGIMGIGRDKAYSLCGEFGSRFMIEEWGYPDIGVVICDCPSAGHDVVMLDYRKCGRQGEPEVIHVDQEADYGITFLANDFESFIQGLVNEDVYDTSEEDKQYDLQIVASGVFSPLLAELCANATEIEDMEDRIRTVCTRIVEDKGYFAFHSDELSTLMYDVQFWLYTKSYPHTSQEQYLAAYERMIAFGGEFSTNGYAPAFITDWLEDRMRQGMIVEIDGTLGFTDRTIDELHQQLNAVLP